MHCQKLGWVSPNCKIYLTVFVSWVKLNLGIFLQNHFLATLLTPSVVPQILFQFIKSEKVGFSLDLILRCCLCFIYVMKIILALFLQKIEDCIGGHVSESTL